MYKKTNIINRLARVFRIAGRASNNFSPAFFISNHKSIGRKIKNRLVYKNIPYSKGPGNVAIAVTNNCDYRCLFCFEHSPLQINTEAKVEDQSYLESRMEMGVFRRLIDDLTDLGGVSSICIPGRIGEPFLHPEFIEMCRYIKEKGISCFITTHGSLIAEEQTKAVVDLGIEQIYISVNASNPDTYYKLTGANSDRFTKVLKIIRFLADYKKGTGSIKPKIFLINVICNLNYLEVAEMVRIGLQAGVDNVGFHKMYFCRRRKALIKDLLLDEKQTEALRGELSKANTLAKKYNINTNIDFFSNLLIEEGPMRPLDYQRQAWRMQDTCNILADGLVYAEDYPYPLGNINHNSFTNIWYSQQYRWLRNNADYLAGGKPLFPCLSSCRCCSNPLYEKDAVKE